jgi:hypothetical protein
LKFTRCSDIPVSKNPFVYFRIQYSDPDRGFPTQEEWEKFMFPQPDNNGQGFSFAGLANYTVLQLADLTNYCRKSVLFWFLGQQVIEQKIVERAVAVHRKRGMQNNQTFAVFYCSNNCS